MIGFYLLDDTIPLPKLSYDALGAAYVHGQTDREPVRHPAPDYNGGPDVPDPLYGVDPDAYDYDWTSWPV